MSKIFVEDTSLTAIANGFRNSRGITENLTLTKMAELAAEKTDPVILHKDIPEYIKSAASNLVSKVNAVKKNESIIFLAISDPHHCKDQNITGWTDNINTGNLHAAMAAKILAYSIKFDFMCLLGDVTIGNADTTVPMLQSQIDEFNSYIDEAFDGIPQFRSPGNHDTGWYRYDSTKSTSDLAGASYLFSAFGSYCEGAIYGSTEHGYCYRDFEDKKIRVICLNCVEGETIGSQSYCCSPAQLLWFAQTLYSVGSKSDAADWVVLTVCHYPLDYGAMATTASKVLYAYVSGGSTTQNGTTVNFSGHNAAKAIGNLHGHTHCFRYDKLYWADQLSTTAGVYESYAYDAYKIAVPNACFERNNSSASATWNGITWGESKAYNKSVGTANDTAFVVNVLNPSEELIHSFCYGAGYDRTISYAGVKYYSIQTNLTGATMEHSSTTVRENYPYIGTFIVSDGYELDSVTVYMGGVDVTDEYYYASNNQIHINVVTGDVIITIKAKEPPVNLLKQAIELDGSPYNGGTGYKAGYHISSSNGSDNNVNADFYISGYMPVANITDDTIIQLYNIGNEYKSYRDSIMLGYSSLAQGAANGQVVLTSIEKENNMIVVTKDNYTSNDWSRIKYIRISCTYIGDDSAVYIE